MGCGSSAPVDSPDQTVYRCKFVKRNGYYIVVPGTCDYMDLPSVALNRKVWQCFKSIDFCYEYKLHKWLKFLQSRSKPCKLDGPESHELYQRHQVVQTRLLSACVLLVNVILRHITEPTWLISAFFTDHEDKVLKPLYNELTFIESHRWIEKRHRYRVCVCGSGASSWTEFPLNPVSEPQKYPSRHEMARRNSFKPPVRAAYRQYRVKE